MNERIRLRLGVVGVGRRGREHLDTIAALGDRYDLVAVCDLSEAAAQAAAASTGVKAYSNLREFFQSAKPDVIVITTPPDTHHVVVRMAAERGVHMLVETPLALTRAMMDSILEDVARTGVKAEVGENMWRRPSDRLTRQVLDAGLIGRVLRISSYYDDAGENSCYHTMSRMRIYADSEVEEVRAYARNFQGVAPVDTGRGFVTDETWTQAELRYANGIIGSCTYVTNWTRPLRAGHPRFTSIEGTEGFIVTGLGSPNMVRRLEDGRAVDYPLKVETRSIEGVEVPVRFSFETSPAFEFVNPFADRIVYRGGQRDGIARAVELDSLYRAVTKDEEPAYTVARARRDQELSILITESARVDRVLPARFESDAETPWEHEKHEAFRRRWGLDPIDDIAEFIARY